MVQVWAPRMHACSVTSNSLEPHGLWPSRLLCPWDFPRQEYWSGLIFPLPGNLSDPGTEGISPESPALAGRFFFFFSHWATRKSTLRWLMQWIKLGKTGEMVYLGEKWWIPKSNWNITGTWLIFFMEMSSRMLAWKPSTQGKSFIPQNSSADTWRPKYSLNHREGLSSEKRWVDSWEET